MRVASSSGNHGPLFTFALSQHGALPMPALHSHLSQNNELKEKEKQRERRKNETRKDPKMKLKTIGTCSG
ncbi:hypothetical protein ACOSP7_013135 [Xanthoceras sorbifolium]